MVGQGGRQVVELCDSASSEPAGSVRRARMPMSEEETILAIGILVVAMLLTMFVMDQCKRRRNNMDPMSHARRVQQDRTARPDGSHIIDHKAEANARNNTGDYRAVSYEHNNPTAGKKRGGVTMVRPPTPNPLRRAYQGRAQRLCVAAGIDPRPGRRSVVAVRRGHADATGRHRRMAQRGRRRRREREATYCIHSSVCRQI